MAGCTKEEVAEDVGEGGGSGGDMVAVELDAAAVEREDRRDADTRLSRALNPRAGGPWLRSS
jgi:hypothetical protein